MLDGLADGSVVGTAVGADGRKEGGVVGIAVRDIDGGNERLGLLEVENCGVRG